MSSCPGTRLEDYLMWAYDLTVEGESDANSSLQIAEMLGVETRRKVLTPAQFARVVAACEHVRERVEDWLHDFDEENQSWRDYGSYPPEEDELKKADSVVHTLRLSIV